MIAILFGGTLDGTVRELPFFSLELRCPLRRKLRAAREEEMLSPYDVEIYDYTMHFSETEALYTFRTNKAAP